MSAHTIRCMLSAGRSILAPLCVSSASTSTSSISSLTSSMPSQTLRGLFTSPARFGLEEFFDIRPDEEGKPLPVGRAWFAEELRLKSFDDLHQLWYICAKEKNVLLTLRAMHEANGRKAPNHEKARLVSVRKTMARIKTVLSERERDEPDARKAAALRKVINAL